MSNQPIRENVVIVIIRITLNLLYYYYYGDGTGETSFTPFSEVVADV